MSFQFRRKSEFRRIGDAHRNSADWRLAADAYAIHLSERPDDGPIWTQLGHAEKEDGDLAAAEKAYRRAVEVMPTDADVLVHLGHLLKRQNRIADALEVFRSLYRLTLDPLLLPQLRELFTRPSLCAPAPNGGAIAFAIEDFFQSFDRHATTTGIQRVQAGVMATAMADAGLDALFFVGGKDESGASCLFSIDRKALAEIIDYASGEAVDHGVLRMLLMEARLTAAPLSLGQGHTIVHLGAFWSDCTGISDYLEPLSRGARFVLFVYDLIPAVHPEYCDAKLSRLFWQRLSELAYVADLIVTISDHTQAELKAFMTEHGGRDIAMQTVRLAHAQDDRSLNGEGRASSLPARIKAKRYVAYVSTIEGRKNHLYVVRAWQRLIADKVDVPDLVFVGRMGWRADELAALLDSTRNLNGRIHIVHGLSDGELDAVYRGAEFTVFTSFAEGWGLPIGESLSRGIPCVAARSGAIPEVGGEFVDYLDPHDLDDGVAVLRRMIEDGAYRAERSNAIRERFSPRTWHDVGIDMIIAVKTHLGASAEPRGVPAIALREGMMFNPGAIQARVVPFEDQFAHPLSLALAASFYEPEPFGAWLRGRSGELTFGTSAAPGETLVVLLNVAAAPWAVGGRFSVAATSSRLPRRWLHLSASGDLIRLECEVDAEGRCTIGFAYDGAQRTPAGDVRALSVAMKAIGYARHSSAALRLELREQFVFDDAA